MSDRPSDGMELDELRDEFDWMYEFQSRMAERIRGDADVHNLADYVGKLESENAELRQQLADVTESMSRVEERCAKLWELVEEDSEQLDKWQKKAEYYSQLSQLAEADNAKLRELVTDMYRCSDPCNDCPHYNGSSDGFYCDLGIGWKARRMRELGIKS